MSVAYHFSSLRKILRGLALKMERSGFFEFRKGFDSLERLCGVTSGETLSMGRLEGKDILVTGGTTGIGFACAKLFHEEGARVAITGRSEKSLAATRLALGDNVDRICADVSHVTQIQSMADEVKSITGGLDGLLVNAGVAKFKPYQEMDETTFDEIMDVNVKGAWFTIAYCAPFIRPGGSVVIVTSMAPYKGQVGVGVYAASKAAARTMARNFSAELLGQGIRVLALSPGPTRTSLFDRMGTPEEGDAAMERMSSTVPIKRMGTPEEIARAALFLISDDSSFMLGAELVVDGGKSQL
jgi:NAD(P)-dependent dehydrogenase (short-subunit alcohol dehydrogenase family)